MRLFLAALGVDPPGILEQQMRCRGERETHEAGDHEGGAPSQDLAEPAAHQKAEQDAQAGTEGEDRHRGAATIDRIEVGDHRMRRRVGPRLADPDADTCKQQLPVARRRTAQRRHEAEDRKRPRDDAGTVEAISEPCERDPEGRVEHREREPVQEPDLGVGKCKIALDRLGQDREDLPVHEVEREHDEEDRERQAAPGDACGTPAPRSREGCKRRLRRRLPSLWRVHG